MANARDMVTRALRVGEGRKFKAYEKRATRINAIEPEMELLGDEELRAETDSLRERARGGESLDDLLPDTMAEALEHCVQRGHHYAIVDEVDNILIDEARTPLIISGAPEQAAQIYYQFARLARQMEGVPARDRLKSLGESKDTSEAEYDYEYDEKHKTVSPTERGVKRAEEFLGVDNLYLGEHGTLVNHLGQALKAESLYGKDKDYAVVDGHVMIIDEFTGRILEGRRWSDRLHQAVEAEEGVAIGEENQTLATITLQYYCRLFDIISGITVTSRN